jgi:folate-binding protein YgfZ
MTADTPPSTEAGEVRLAGHRAAREGAALFERPGSTLIEVTGSERLAYLNGLVTNKFVDLEPGRAERAFFLVPTKGRVLADLIACETGTATWLECQGGCSPTVLELLGKYYFGQDVAFADRSGEWRVLAIVGPEAGRILTGVLQEVPPAEERTHEESRLGDSAVRALKWSDAGPPGWHLWVPADAFDTARQALVEAGATPGSEQAWTLLQIESGVAAFGRELTEDVIPLEAPTEDAIDHAKGCYPGQEVIARLHVRGRPARHLKGLRIDGEELLDAGTTLDAPDKAGVAVVTASAVSPELGPVALAYVHRDYCEPGTRLTVDGRTAEVAELPFLPPRA